MRIALIDNVHFRIVRKKFNKYISLIFKQKYYFCTQLNKN
jgi:YHS domain-containing protein